MLVAIKKGKKTSLEYPDGIEREHNVRGYYLYNSENGEVLFRSNKELCKLLRGGDKVAGLRLGRDSQGVQSPFVVDGERDRYIKDYGIENIRKSIVS